MSTRAIMSGAVGKAAELRTSKNGTRFATLSIRENVNGASRWWQAIAFAESAIEVLKEISVGEPIAVTGEITAEIYAPAGSESRINWRIQVDAVLSARKVKPEGASRNPQAAKRDRAEASSARQAEASNTGGRALAAAAWASPMPVAAGGVPFDDSIPFCPERR
jgi:single-stranded DNA-binding protein